VYRGGAQKGITIIEYNTKKRASWGPRGGPYMLFCSMVLVGYFMASLTAARHGLHCSFFYLEEERRKELMFSVLHG
jgi:hypothetical protein